MGSVPSYNLLPWEACKLHTTDIVGKHVGFALSPNEAFYGVDGGE